jgi:hypothetical protein
MLHAVDGVLDCAPSEQAETRHALNPSGKILKGIEAALGCIQQQVAVI